MKVFNLILFFTIIISFCSGETVKSDIYVKPDYSLSKTPTVIIGYFNVRTNVPYIKLNFKEQLEYHLLKRNYKVIPREKLLGFYKINKLKFNRSLRGEEIKKAHKIIPFDHLIQGILYEEDRSLFDEGNHIIVHLNLYSPEGEKISTIRYIYSGERSLISGELIDDAISKLLNKLDAYRK